MDLLQNCDTDKPKTCYISLCIGCVFRWYTSYNEFIGSLAIFLTATVAVVLEHGEENLGPGKVGLALFSVFQARLPTYLYRISSFNCVLYSQRPSRREKSL